MFLSQNTYHWSMLKLKFIFNRASTQETAATVFQRTPSFFKVAKQLYMFNYSSGFMFRKFVLKNPLATNFSTSQKLITRTTFKSCNCLFYVFSYVFSPFSSSCGALLTFLNLTLPKISIKTHFVVSLTRSN